MPLPTPKRIFGMALPHGSILLKEMAKFKQHSSVYINYALMNLESMEVTCRKLTIIMKLSAYGTQMTRVSLSQCATCTDAHILNAVHMDCAPKEDEKTQPRKKV
jgi:hypothetical protein